MLKLYTVIHPADDGWRWAIHADDRLDEVGFGHLGSAIEPTQTEAEGTLGMVLSVVRCALTVAEVPTQVVQSVRADCPLNADIVAELAKVMA